MANHYSTKVQRQGETKRSKTAHVHISVPTKIRQRMIDYRNNEGVVDFTTWSEIASKAFEEYLDQHEDRHERKKQKKRRAG